MPIPARKHARGTQTPPSIRSSAAELDGDPIFTSFVMYPHDWTMLALENVSAAYGRIRTMLEEAPAVVRGWAGCGPTGIRDFIKSAHCRSFSVISTSARGIFAFMIFL